MKLNFAASVLAAALVFAGSAHASIVLSSFTPVSGSGLGAVNTILTVQSPGSSTTESGCVAFGDVIGEDCFGAGTDGGDELTGTSQTRTRTLLETGIVSASDFGIVLNSLQPGGGPITVNTLDVRFYSSTGTILFTAGLEAPVDLPSTATGAGRSGYLFVLDPVQGALATGAGAFASPTNVIGLNATLTNATGGLETLFAGSFPGGSDPSEVPEPASMFMLGSGLLGLCVVGRRFVKK